MPHALSAHIVLISKTNWVDWLLGWISMKFVHYRNVPFRGWDIFHAECCSFSLVHNYLFQCEYFCVIFYNLYQIEPGFSFEHNSHTWTSRLISPVRFIIIIIIFQNALLNTHQVIINLGTSALLQLAAIDKFMLRVIGKKWCKMSVSFYFFFFFFFFPFVWGAPGRFHIIVMESSFMHLGNEIKICTVENYSHDFSYRSAWHFFLPPFKL